MVKSFLFETLPASPTARNCSTFLLSAFPAPVLFFFYWYNVLSHWDFSHRKFGLLSRGKPNGAEFRYPTYGACWLFWCFHIPPNFDMDCRTLNVRTYVILCIRLHTRGCTDTVRESALKVDSWRLFPCRTGESNLCPAACRSDALPVPSQLRYTLLQPFFSFSNPFQP